MQGSSSKGNQPQKPPSEQPLKEEAVKGTSKGKKPEKAATKESVPGSSSKDEHSQQSPSQQDEAAPGSSKRKRPQKPKPKKTIHQLPPGKTKDCMEYPIHFPLDVLDSFDYLEDTEPPDRDFLLSLSEEAKGKQPAPKLIPLYAIPRVSILRIPIARDGPLQRVQVSVRGDTATRHWQTFFFKNIVCLEPFLGETNDKAFVATRIVRLMTNDGKPTSYFLMVCIGEYPRIRSPRNDNEVFKGMREHIYNDAFVFRLGDPELGVAGYANYVDFDKDIDGIDWLRQAIRTAARKVSSAMARHANPGFPDMSNYADEETMRKDVRGMTYVMTQIAKAEEKYAAPYDIIGISGPKDLEGMRARTDDMLRQIRIWRDEGLLYFEVEVGSAEWQATDTFGLKTIEFWGAIRQASTATELDNTPSASTDVGSPSTSTDELCKRAEECFMAVKTAYEPVEALVTKEIHDKVADVQKIKDPNTECDLKWLKYMAISVIMAIIEVKKDDRVNAALKAGYFKHIDLFAVKAQATYQAIDENKTYQEIMRLVIETNEIHQTMADTPTSR